MSSENRHLYKQCRNCYKHDVWNFPLINNQTNKIATIIHIHFLINPVIVGIVLIILLEFMQYNFYKTAKVSNKLSVIDVKELTEFEHTRSICVKWCYIFSSRF